MLESKAVFAGYGGAPILKGVNLSIEEGDIGVIVGPNGAGKSSFLKSLFSLIEVSQGRITFDGNEITNQPADQLVALGMSFVPQEKNIFVSMTVEENLQMGAYLRTDSYQKTLSAVYHYFPDLKDKRLQLAGELSGGQRQMVAMGRALMTEPRLLLLDEPTAGLSPRYMDEIFDRICTINREGVSVLMVEQHAKQALAIASKGFVLVSGKNRFTDTGKNLLNNPDVAKSFLGA